MEFETIRKTITKGYWLNDIPKLTEVITKSNLSKKNFKLVMAELEANVKSLQVGKTVNWLLFSLIYNQKSTFNYIVRNRLFSLSSLNYSSGFASRVYSEICQKLELLHLDKQIVDYFQSKNSFLSSHKIIEKQYKSILKIVKSNQNTIFKDLMILTDYYFLFDVIRKNFNDPLKIEFYSKEEIAESISFILHILFNKLKVKNVNANAVNANQLINNGYSELIVNTCLLKKIVEWEMLIDSFGYRCIKEQSHLNIIPPGDYFEKAIQRGWIYTFIQKANFNLKIIKMFDNEALSLEDFASKIYSNIGDKIVHRKTVPSERFVLEIPAHPQVMQFIKGDKFYLEEIVTLSEQCREMFVDVDELLDFEINGMLTFRDVLHVQRLFNLIRLIFANLLKEHLKSEPEIVLKSLLPVYKKDTLLQIIETVIDRAKAEVYLELFTWSNDKEKLLDLQYRPIINFGDNYFVPMNTMCKSDYFRNTLFIARKRLYENKPNDPISEVLKRDLENKGFPCSLNVEFEFQGKEGDIDLISKIGTTIFLVETKNTLFPGNIFELRTTYDHLVKAGEQLHKITTLMEQNDFVKYIEAKSKLDIRSFSRICTCIVIGNRSFSGFKTKGHSVRSLFELSHFINEGTVAYEDGNLYQLWDSDKFTEDDLINYVEHDNFHKLEYDILKKNLVSYPLGKCEFQVHTFAADYTEFSDNLKKTFKYSSLTC